MVRVRFGDVLRPERKTPRETERCDATIREISKSGGSGMRRARAGKVGCRVPARNGGKLRWRIFTMKRDMSVSSPKKSIFIFLQLFIRYVRVLFKEGVF